MLLVAIVAWPIRMPDPPCSRSRCRTSCKALRNLGVKYEHAFSCDICKFARATIEANFPHGRMYQDFLARSLPPSFGRGGSQLPLQAMITPDVSTMRRVIGEQGVMGAG